MAASFVSTLNSGVVVEVQPHNVGCLCAIDDGTGIVVVRVHAKIPIDVRPHMYVLVVGMWKPQASTGSTLHAQQMIDLTHAEPNQETMWLLEGIFAPRSVPIIAHQY